MRAYTFSCDKCGESVTQTAETTPDRWVLVLIGSDSRGPNKWKHKLHMCEPCYDDMSRYLSLLTAEEVA